MLSSLISYAIQLVIGLAIVIILYQIFLSDYIKEKQEVSSAKQVRLQNTDKIARVKLTSDDPKEIEKFITDNAQYLSDSMVQQLVTRIENIKDDRVITADNVLKSKIDSLEEPAVVKRASRGK